MLGGNLLLAKVAVFALAAGIAGLGGALYAMQQQSITSTQFTFEAGLAIFLIAVVGGVASVGSGFFAGAVLIGPINALVAVAAWATNPVSLFPGLAGMAFGRSPDGIVPLMRRDWAPVARYKIVVAAALAISAALWLLRLAGLVNGWVLFWGIAVVAVALRAYAAARTTPAPTRAYPAAPTPTAGSPTPTPISSPGPGPAEDPVPIEWWGLSRPWRAEDEEVLDRAIARG
jgi:branched-chain amino acid transport system permease protein